MRHADDADSRLRRVARAAEAAEIEKALRACDGDAVAAAYELGLTRSGFYAAVKRVGVDLAAIKESLLARSA